MMVIARIMIMLKMMRIEKKDSNYDYTPGDSLVVIKTPLMM